MDQQRYTHICRSADMPPHEVPNFDEAKAWAKKQGYIIGQPVVSDELEIVVIELLKAERAD
jgi:hypothetical protein